MRRRLQTKWGTSRRAAPRRARCWLGCARLSEVHTPADIARLAREAEVHEISLGQLLATLIEAAMAEGLSRVLDDESSREPPE